MAKKPEPTLDEVRQEIYLLRNAEDDADKVKEYDMCLRIISCAVSSVEDSKRDLGE